MKSMRHLPQFDRVQQMLLQDALGEEHFRAMLADLSTEIDLLRHKIDVAMKAEDFDAASRASLILRSLASNFGAVSLAAYCRDFSRRLCSGSAMPSHATALSHNIEKTLVALDLLLGDGLQKDEFEVFYQPWFDVRSRRIMGCEALVRWRHPVRGLLGATQFVPIAEDLGLIAQLSSWILHKACADAMSWPDDVKLSINLSHRQYAGDYLCAAVRDALAQTGLAPERLEFEIVDPLTAADLQKLQKNLDGLNAIGVSIVLDRFGSGQSSLEDIRKVPCKRLKLDKTLIADVCKNTRDARMIASMVALAQSIGLALTASGVETSEQAEALQLAGCVEMQGYLFGRPQSAAATAALFRRGEYARPA